MKYSLILLAGILLCSAGISTANAEIRPGAVLTRHHGSHGSHGHHSSHSSHSYHGSHGYHGSRSYHGYRGPSIRFYSSRSWVPGHYVWIHHHRRWIPGHYR